MICTMKKRRMCICVPCLPNATETYIFGRVTIHIQTLCRSVFILRVWVAGKSSKLSWVYPLNFLILDGVTEKV